MLSVPPPSQNSLSAAIVCMLVSVTVLCSIYLFTIFVKRKKEACYFENVFRRFIYADENDVRDLNDCSLFEIYFQIKKKEH